MSFFVIFRSFSQKTTGPGSNYVQPLSGVRKYLVQKTFDFIQGYEKVLETKFPTFFRVYQVFSIGTKELYQDVKEYIRISSDLRNGMSVRDLHRKELETYFKVPKDLKKVGPVLLIAALPFANYVILPLIYVFPRQFLSSHFWSLQQKMDFAVRKQRKRLYYYRPVFRQLQAKVSSVNEADLKIKCQDIFYKLGSGIHPSVKEILEVKPLFTNEPYSLSSLSSKHLRCLCHMYGLSAFPGKQSRLWRHAGFIREMDLAIHREGIQSMQQNELRWACFLRGLSPVGLQREQMIEWLERWNTIALNTDSRSLSLLLHSPLFLSYNFPSNWVLIH